MLMQPVSPPKTDSKVCTSKFVACKLRTRVKTVENSVAGNIPTVTEDVLTLQKKIEQFLNEKKFDEALTICPTDWIVTRERIQEKQKLLV